MLDDKYLEIWDSNEIVDLHNCLRRCVEEKNLEGFDEAIIKFVSEIQKETLKLSKKIVTSNLI